MAYTEKLNSKRVDLISKDQVQESVKVTNKLLSTFQTGPQSERLEDDDIEAALMDERTVCIELEGVHIPVLIPIEKMSEYKLDYIEKLGFDINTTYFMPAYAGLLDIAPSIRDIIVKNIEDKKSHNGVHVFVYPHEDDKSEIEYIQTLIGGAQEVPLIDSKNGTQASITHFEGLVVPSNETKQSDYKTLRDVFLDLVKRKELQEYIKDGVTILNPQEIANNADLREQLWNLCISQFDDLGEGLPFEQGFEKDEFINNVLSNPKTTTIAHYKEGKPDCIATFMHDIKDAYWLSDNYFKDKCGDDFMSYFVLIAKEKGASGRPSMEIINMLVKLTQEANKQMWVTFECTNVSAGYIPKIVSMAVNSSHTLKINVNETGHYPVRAYSLVT